LRPQLAHGLHLDFARYFVSGGAAFAVHLLTLSALVELVAVPPVTATAVGFLVALCVNYVLQHRWVFRSTGRHRTLFVRYVVVTIVTFAINIALFGLFYEILGLWYILSQIMATGLIFIVNFFVNRHYTFRIGKEISR
jgi:putative flippase GtrA